MNLLAMMFLVLLAGYGLQQAVKMADATDSSDMAIGLWAAGMIWAVFLLSIVAVHL